MYFFRKYIVTLFYKKLRIKFFVCLLRESGPRSKTVLLKLYKAWVRQHLEYCVKTCPPPYDGWYCEIGRGAETINKDDQVQRMERFRPRSTVFRLSVIITRNLNCTAKCRSKLRGAGHCTSASRMTSIMRHVAETFPPARQGTILNNHRVIDIATNTSMVLNCAFMTYIKITADVGLPDAV